MPFYRGGGHKLPEIKAWALQEKPDKTPKDGTPGKVEESGEDVVVTDKENDEAPHGARPLT